jgi:hypothetical protein
VGHHPSSPAAGSDPKPAEGPKRRVKKSLKVADVHHADHRCPSFVATAALSILSVLQEHDDRGRDQTVDSDRPWESRERTRHVGHFDPLASVALHGAVCVPQTGTVGSPVDSCPCEMLISSPISRAV